MERYQVIRETIEIVNSFSLFFCSVTHNIQSEVNYVFEPYQHYLTSLCNNICHVTSYSKEEVIEAI